MKKIVLLSVCVWVSMYLAASQKNENDIVVGKVVEVNPACMSRVRVSSHDAAVQVSLVGEGMYGGGVALGRVLTTYQGIDEKHLCCCLKKRRKNR